MANYRPITNLNTIRKILERLVQKKLRLHMERSVNEGPVQSAYRALHSNETAMTRVVNDLLIAKDAVPRYQRSIRYPRPRPAAESCKEALRFRRHRPMLAALISVRSCTVRLNGWVSLICDYKDFGSSTRISIWAVVILHLHDACR